MQIKKLTKYTGIYDVCVEHQSYGDKIHNHEGDQ